MRARRAFTLIELLTVLAIIAILSTLGFTRFRRDSYQVQQAARSFTTSVQKARYEAVSKNVFAGIKVSGTEFFIYRDSQCDGTDTVVARQYDTSDCIVSKVPLGSGDYSHVTLAKGTYDEFVFTPRGTPFGVTPLSLAFTSRLDSSYIWDVDVSAQGRVTVAKR